MNEQYEDDEQRTPDDGPGADTQGYGQPNALRGPLLRQCPQPYERTGGHVAVVQMYGNGGYTVQRHDRPREDHDKPLLRRATSVYEVALGRHVTRFKLSLPAAGDAEFFRADAAVRWEVEDPVLIVHRQVWDVAELLQDDLVDHLRYVSRRFRLTEAQAAEETLQSELESGRFALGSDLGLRTKVHVRIDLSRRVGERISAGSHMDLQLALTDKEHALNRRREQQQSELVRERARDFESLLARGDESRIAYFMAREPGKALQIEQHFARERRQDEADRVGFLNRLIDAGLIERHDIREGVYEALQYLQQSGRSLGRTVSAALPGQPQHQGELDPASPPARRRPFWEEKDEGDTTALEAAPAEGETDGHPDVHEPSSVESAEERAERTRVADDFTAPRRPGRASDRFDDWGD